MYPEERRAGTSLLTAAPTEAMHCLTLARAQGCHSVDRCRRGREVTQKVKKVVSHQPKTDLLNNPLTSFKIKCSAELETLVD